MKLALKQQMQIDTQDSCAQRPEQEPQTRECTKPENRPSQAQRRFAASLQFGQNNIDSRKNVSIENIISLNPGVLHCSIEIAKL